MDLQDGINVSDKPDTRTEKICLAWTSSSAPPTLGATEPRRLHHTLSVLAYDYPAEKLSVYLSDDGSSILTFYALWEASRSPSTGYRSAGDTASSRGRRPLTSRGRWIRLALSAALRNGHLSRTCTKKCRSALILWSCWETFLKESK